MIIYIINIGEMGKTQKQQKNKTHKTLRDKLRKKREQLKRHKKQKSQKHKEYDAEGKKLKFYHQKYINKTNQPDIKQEKVRKHLQKFIDIYEDDLEDFYDIFITFDDGGCIDIANVADPKIQKCLKKIFKYLPLKKKKSEYTKKQKVSVKLDPIIKKYVSESIENYLQNGTDSDSSKSDSQVENVKKSKKIIQKVKIETQKTPLKQEAKTQKQQINQLDQIKLYPQAISQSLRPMGPSLSEQDKNKLAEMFQKQMQKQRIGPCFDEQQRANNPAHQDQDDFARIFSMATSKKQNDKNKNRSNIDEIPQQLLADGSAKIGQKQPVDMNQIQQYNKIHRPKKLIEQHQQIMKIGKYSEEDPNKRKPFNRERDIVNGGNRSKFMNNGVFFDFKQKMTQPKGTNNFL